MKKLSSFILFLLATLMLASCSALEQKKNKLRDEVKATQKSLPSDLGAKGKLTDITYENDLVTMTITYSSTADVNLQSMSKKLEKAKSVFMRQYHCTEGRRELLKDLAGAEASLRYIFKGGKTGGSVTLDFTKEEVATMSENPTKEFTPRQILEVDIEQSDIMYPVEVDDDVTLTSAAIEGDYVVYTCTVNESKVDLSMVDVSLVRKQHEKNQKSNDPSMEIFIKKCKKANCGIRYIYVGSKSGKKLTIDFKPSEL